MSRSFLMKDHTKFHRQPVDLQKNKYHQNEGQKDSSPQLDYCPISPFRYHWWVG